MNWRQWALCRGADPDVFVPEAPPQELPRAVQDLCPPCPVRAVCEAYGRRTGSTGWWGGQFLDDVAEPRLAMAVRECIQCGRSFLSRNADIAMYCSTNCVALASYHRRRGHVPLRVQVPPEPIVCECEWCGDTFSAERPYARFCSSSCKQKSKRRRRKVGAVRVTVLVVYTIEVAA